jgi:hypothetical protein
MTRKAETDTSDDAYAARVRAAEKAQEIKLKLSYAVTAHAVVRAIGEAQRRLADDAYRARAEALATQNAYFEAVELPHVPYYDATFSAVARMARRHPPKHTIKIRLRPTKGFDAQGWQADMRWPFKSKEKFDTPTEAAYHYAALLFGIKPALAHQIVSIANVPLALSDFCRYPVAKYVVTLIRPTKPPKTSRR